MLPKACGLITRENSRTDTTQGMSNTRRNIYLSKIALKMREQAKERDRETAAERDTHPTVWVSIFYWNLLTRGVEYSLLGVGISGKQGFVPYLSSLFGQGFPACLVSHLVSVWVDLTSCALFWSAARTGLWLSQQLGMASSLLASRNLITPNSL